MWLIKAQNQVTIFVTCRFLKCNYVSLLRCFVEFKSLGNSSPLCVKFGYNVVGFIRNLH